MTARSVNIERTLSSPKPETMQVLAASRYSEKVDIYSLGVVLWEIVTGLMPEVRQADAVNIYIQGR